MTAFLGYNNSPKWHKYVQQSSITSYTTLNHFTLPLSFKKKFIREIYRAYSTTKPQSSNNANIIVNNFIIEKAINPVVCYKALNLEETKQKIKLYSKGKSGIYLILNNITLDYYIGSASTNKIYSRYYNHLIGLTGSKLLKLAVKKYKLENFTFMVLENFPEIVTKENNKKLLDLENFYLKTLLPNYNILTEAGNTFGYKHTELDRIKMKTNYSESRRMQIGSLNRGKPLSDETKEKMRKIALTRLPRTFSPEALANMKKASKSIVVYNKDGTIYGNYASITEASFALNCSVKTIYRSLKSDSKLLRNHLIVKYGTYV